jgi:RND family efflux transporter MFP subunit
MRSILNRYVFVPAALALLAGTLACKDNARPAAASGRGGPEAEAKSVRLVPATAQLFGKTVEATGTLAADDEASLSFKVPGRVVAISVDLGTLVRKGDAIGRLDTSDYELKVSQAQASLQQARARLGLNPAGEDTRVDLQATGTVRQAKAVLDESRANRERMVRLAETGVIARAELDRYESEYRVAEARYQDAIEEVRNRQAVLLQRASELAITRQQLADTVLRAPFDGAISERVAASGEYVAAGAPVAKLVRISPLRMRAEVPEREAAGLTTGSSVEVMVEGAGSATGRVARISPVITERSRVLTVEIEVDNSRGALRPGGFARAKIGTEVSAPAVVVPESAVVAYAGAEKVFLVSEGKAVEKLVTTGRHEGGRVELLSGLEANEMVVEVPGNLAAGQPVTVQ